MTRLKLGWCWVVVLAMVGSTYAGEIENPSDTTEAQTSPLFESVALPYDGDANVAVLNNGLVAIEIGEASFYLAPDMTDLKLIETDDGEWLLMNTVAVPSGARVIPFDKDAVPNYETARESLLTIQGGSMFLRIGDAETDTYCLEIVSQESRVFSFDFRPAPAKTDQRGCTGSCSCNAGPCPKHGDTCTTRCTNRCCLCYCDGTRPICKCIDTIPKEIVVPKDADLFPPA